MYRWHADAAGRRSRLLCHQAIDFLNGEITARGRVDSSPVVAGGRVYVGSSDGRLYKESYRDTQLGLAGIGNQAEAGGYVK